MLNKADTRVVVNFDEERIASWTEADLLNVVVTMYEIDHRCNSHLEDIRAALGDDRPKSLQAITNYLAANGSIGLDGWRRVFELTHNEFIVPWIRLHMKFLFE